MKFEASLAYQKVVMTMHANDPAHSRHIWNRGLWWSRGGQADDPSAIGPGACDPHARVFADQKTIAWTSYIFPTGGCISDGRGLTTRGALHHMLFTFSRNINHSLKIERNDDCIVSANVGNDLKKVQRMRLCVADAPDKTSG